MASSRRRDESPLDDLYDLLVGVPAWVGPLLAAIVFVGLTWIVPWWLSSSPSTDDTAPLSAAVHRSMSQMIPQIGKVAGPLLSGLVLMVWVAAEIKKRVDRKRLDRQTGIESIRTLNWREFEQLLAEAFRRNGYFVEHLGGSGPDGGIDLRLSKAGETTLVQCKHWNRDKVGVTIVRELLGVVTSEGARGGIVVASGRFTPEAVEFASHNRLQLIDGTALAALIHNVQPTNAPAPQPVLRQRPPASPQCPICNSPMKKRMAKQGASAGKPFWGCVRYPQCRGIRDIA